MPQGQHADQTGSAARITGWQFGMQQLQAQLSGGWQLALPASRAAAQNWQTEQAAALPLLNTALSHYRSARNQSPFPFAILGQKAGHLWPHKTLSFHFSS